MMSKKEQIDLIKKLTEIGEYCYEHSDECYLVDEDKKFEDCPYHYICKGLDNFNVVPDDFCDPDGEVIEEMEAEK